MLKKYSDLVVYKIIKLLKVLFLFGHHMCFNIYIFESQLSEKRLTEGFSY